MICSTCGKQFEVDEEDIIQINEGELEGDDFLIGETVGLIHRDCLTQPMPFEFMGTEEVAK